MFCLIELDGGKHCIERSSFKEVKKEINNNLKKNKVVFLNGQRITKPFTKEDWAALEKG
jgi:hypothetical protein